MRGEKGVSPDARKRAYKRFNEPVRDLNPTVRRGNHALDQRRSSAGAFRQKVSARAATAVYFPVARDPSAMANCQQIRR
jgi:hypothetical protein